MEIPQAFHLVTLRIICPDISLFSCSREPSGLLRDFLLVRFSTVPPPWVRISKYWPPERAPFCARTYPDDASGGVVLGRKIGSPFKHDLYTHAWVEGQLDGYPQTFWGTVETLAVSSVWSDLRFPTFGGSESPRGVCLSARCVLLTPDRWVSYEGDHLRRGSAPPLQSSPNMVPCGCS